MRLGVSACPLTFATICLVFHLQAPSCIEAAAVTSCIATTTTTTRRVIFSSASTTAPPSPRPKAELTSDLIRCGAFLRVGGLVAFPTETVYGLGANAYMEKSVERIFEVKGRPLTDPLIVHVAQAEEAWAVFACGSAANSSSSSSSEAQAAHHAKEKQLISTLAASFWPGPLTLVAPAAADLPLAVSAGTGWVGVRVPSHPLARALLRAASVPVVAPSANRFGHVSPTSAAHVEADLGGHTMLILEGGREGEGDGEKAVCEIGIESTVVKVDAKEGRLTVLRAGAITCSQLKACVKGMDVEVLVKDHSSSSSSSANHHHHQQQQQQQGRKILAEDDSEPQIAPGQCIKHYAPDRPTYLLSPSRALEGWAAAVAKQAVVLDVGGRLGGLEGVAVFYRDLSRKGDPREAAARLFEGLRWAESAERKGVKGELVVLVVDLREEGGTRGAQEDKEFEMALMDRVMRSASGQEAGAFLLEG
ncbi:sua5 family protein [Nannochloropsis oceanica]